MAQASTIALLQNPPSWMLASHADSDWVLRQKLREERGIRMNRHQRRNRFKLVNEVDGHVIDGIADKEEDFSSQLLGKPSIRAIIASGTGPDGRAEARKLMRQRRIMVRSIAIAVLSVFAALAKTYSSPLRQLKQQLQREEYQRDLTMEGCVSESLEDATRNSRAYHEREVLAGKPEVVVSLHEEYIVTDHGKQSNKDTPSFAEEGESMAEATSKEMPQDGDDSSGLCADDEVSCFFLFQA